MYGEVYCGVGEEGFDYKMLKIGPQQISLLIIFFLNDTIPYKALTNS